MSGIARHTPTLIGDNAIRLVVADIALLPDIGDALTRLTNTSDWVEVGDPVDDIVQSVSQTITDYYNLMLVGLVSQFLAAIPSGWLQLDGATHSQDDYPILFDRLPNQFKNGANFTLPDFTNVYPNGAANVAAIGTESGSNSLTLSIAQLPSHTHTEIPAIVGVEIGGAGPPFPSTAIGPPIASGPAGSGSSIDNRPASVELLFAVYAGQE